MTGRRMIHAHRLIKSYSEEPVPTRMFAARSDGLGRDHSRITVPVNPSLMQMVMDFPVFYWSHEALINASSWTVDHPKEDLVAQFTKVRRTSGAVHFFDTIQRVDNAELGLIHCVGMVRYSTDMFALLYVKDDFKWDNLSDGLWHYNIYFCNGSTFAEHYQTMLFMWEAWARMPVEVTGAKAEPFSKNPNQLKGIDNKTRKSYQKNPVRVITLRKVVKPDGETFTNGKNAMREALTNSGPGNTINVQFDVRGHERKQWYPSEGKHRVIWVEGYTKGKDKPKKETPTIHKVINR